MKKRLDVLLVDLGLLDSREKAKTVIMSGQVYVDNQKADKPGLNVDENSKIEVRGETLKYVSRGGLKLEKSIEKFNIDLSGCICVDIGASTGGFTDCMLQNGAKKVYAVDVGYGQLAWKLRNDSRVINLERTNIRYVTNEQIPDIIDFISIDVSFISLVLVLPTAINILGENGKIVCLVKPQFEAGKGRVGKKGVVREPEIHIEVINKILCFAVQNKLDVLALDYSPIKGPEGNIEYLMLLKKGDGSSLVNQDDIINVVNSSHTAL